MARRTRVLPPEAVSAMSAVLLWLPELLGISLCLGFAVTFGLWWLLIPVAVIAVKVALQIRAGRRQNQRVVEAYLRAAARQAVEQATEVPR